MSSTANASGMGMQGIASAQEAAIQLIKLSPSMSLQLPGSESTDSLRLTPFLNSPFAVSPFMGTSVDSGFKLSPAMFAAHQNSAQSVYKHRTEHNKFQHSFSAALTMDPSPSPSDAEVPQMAKARAANMPGPAATTERVVPAPGRSRSASRTKTTTSAAKKTTKRSVAVTSSTATSKSTGSRAAATKAAAATTKATATTKAAAAKRKGKTVPPEESRKEKRREQNRVNAAKCRQRKIDKVVSLQSELEKLHAENASLKLAYMELERKLQSCYSK